MLIRPGICTRPHIRIVGCWVKLCRKLPEASKVHVSNVNNVLKFPELTGARKLKE